jgi:hypothetical protein
VGQVVEVLVATPLSVRQDQPIQVVAVAVAVVLALIMQAATAAQAS